MSDLDVLAGSVRQFLAREVVPTTADRTGKAIPDELWRLAGEYGYLGMHIAERHGGAGVAERHFAAVLADECMKAGATGFGLALAMHGVVADVLAAHAPAAAERWLPRLASGEALASIAGLDVPLVADGNRVSGTAAAVVAGASAELIAVLACDADGAVVVLVEAADPGLSPQAADELLAAPGAGIADVRIDVTVPADRVLPAAAVEQLRADHALSVSLLAQAGAQVALELTADYTRDRTVFGSTLASFENTQYALAEVSAHIAASGALLDGCIATRSGGPVSYRAAAQVALTCTAAYLAAADTGLQLHGGYGYMREYPIAQYYADARLLRLLAVPADGSAHRAVRR